MNQLGHSKKGRPPTIDHHKPIENDTVTDHWSSDPISIKILQVLSNFGAYALPLETGVKSRKRWRYHPTIFKELYQASKEQLDWKIERLEQIARDTYGIEGFRRYFFVLQKKKDQLDFDEVGNLKEILEDEPFVFRIPNCQKLSPNQEERFKRIIQGFQKLAIYLEPSVCESLQDLLDVFFLNFKEVKEDLIESLVDRVKGDGYKHRELLALQLIKDSTKEEKRILDLDPLEMIPHLHLCGQNHRAQRMTKAELKRLKMAYQQGIQITPREQQLIEDDCALVREFVRALVKAFYKDD